MDLIFTNASRVDQGVLTAYAFDLSFGADENDFEMTLGEDAAMLESGAVVYMEGTEYGGTIDAMKTSTNGESITYMGRTWHGVINSKVIQPDNGEDYLIVSGDANEILSMLIARLGLSGLFVAVEMLSGINVRNYKFHRYCKAYDGIRDMLADNGAKLKIAWRNRSVTLSAEPIADYTESPVDGDIATLNVEQHQKKVNHLICLGKGDLAAREVIHLFVDQFGRIGDVQYYTGLDEIMDTYDNTNSENLRSDGIKRLKELRNSDKAEIDLPETGSQMFDIGDIVGATDIKSGIVVVETVTQKIIRITNGKITTEYKTGGKSTTNSSCATSSSGGESGGGNSYNIPVATDATLGAIKVGDNLEITEDGTLSVSTTDKMQHDNTLPITSAGVYVEVGNVNTLLATI